MLLCLQEPNDRMSDIVQRNLFESKNVITTCSSSGRLTSSLVKFRRDKVLVPSIGEKVLLLSDSWSHQNDESVYHDRKSIKKDIRLIQILPRTISAIQSLDKYFNRQIKDLAKRICNRVALDQLKFFMSEIISLN